jgi:hypothetical protein
MHDFPTAKGARLLCRTDFSLDPVLNIDFVAGNGTDIPFHLSLRRAEGVAVVNRRLDGAWRRELVWPMAFGPRPRAVEVAFGLGGATVRLDGRLLGRFDPLPRPDRTGRYRLRRGFPGLGRIAAVRLTGALAADSLELICPALPRPAPGLHLSHRLLVEGAGMDLPPGARLHLLAPGLTPPPPALLLPQVHALGPGRPITVLTAVLPGRVWTAAPDRLDLALADAAGTVLGRLSISRADLRARIEAAAAAGIWSSDPLAALQAIEHVRHAGLFDSLGAGARAALAAAAQGLGLAAWLQADSSPSPASSPPTTLPAPALSSFDTTLARIAAQVRGQGADPVALLDAACRAGEVPATDRQELLRALAEAACLSGRMDALAAFAQAQGLLPLPEAPAAWDQSTALPFDLAQGWYPAAAERLRYLASLRDGWAVTPAIAWTVAQVAAYAPGPAGVVPTPDQTRAVLEGWLAYLDSLAADYWSRSPCRALMTTMAGILTQPQRLPDDLFQGCVWTAIRLWGLAPAFWQILDAQPRDGSGSPHPILDEARALCRDLVAAAQAEAPPRDRLDALLTRAQALGMAEAVRMRRELLGPSSLPGGVPDPAAAARRGLNGDETCLRALTHPDGAPPLDPAQDQTLSRAAGRALRRAYPQVPAAPLPDLERQVLTQARALATDPAPTDAALQDWAASLAPLCGPDQASAGLTLTLGLAAELARSGRPDKARALLDHPLLSPPPGTLDTPWAGTGPRLALSVLARHAPDLAQSAAQTLGLTPDATPADPLSQAASPLHDTLVAVYSCQPYLDTRVAALRQGWLRDLAALGVPFLVFTGGGAGERQGDVVHLDAPDDYEGLPQKSLALMRWVLERTGFSRVLKVDDDCWLNAPAWFGDLAHLRHDYYGRPLTRVPGQLDRTWHMAKSRSDRGRLELDKSPEPSRYGDGSTGYMLSRRAMAALARAADSPEGQRLQQLSFLEDKLVGDLLALGGIHVSGQDYRTAVWRRAGRGGTLVPAWENGVLPWQDSPVKLAHLDDAAAVRRLSDQARAARPPTGKVWPSFQPARSGSRSNTLDLVSPPDRLALARAAPVAVVACLRNEAQMLPLFLNHYRRLGVTAFLIADNGSDDGTLDLLLDAPDVALFAVDTEYGQSQYGVAWQQALMANFRMGQWSLMADADELLVWSDDPAARLPDLLARPEFQGRDAARVLMLDMYPRGPLAGATMASGDPFAEAGMVDRDPFLRVSTARGPFSDAEVLTSALRHRLIPGSRPELFVAQKMALLRYRPWMRLTAGLHFVAGTRPVDHDLIFAHFKYTAAFRAKAVAEVARRQHFNDAEEYRKYLALMSEGRDVIHDPAVSVPWRDSDEVRRVFGAWAQDETTGE